MSYDRVGREGLRSNWTCGSDVEGIKTVNLPCVLRFVGPDYREEVIRLEEVTARRIAERQNGTD